MDKEEYRRKLLDPRWQKRRLETFERDHWKCQLCFSAEKTLNVHHRFYLDGYEPWEYPPRALVTLCQDCHDQEGPECTIWSVAFINELKAAGLFAKDFMALSCALGQGNPLPDQPHVWASVLSWMFCDQSLQRELIERYFESLALIAAREKTGLPSEVFPSTPNPERRDLNVR